MRLLIWNQDPCLMDADPRHLVPATLLRHRQRNPSERLGSTDHVISRSQMLNSTLLRSSPTFFRKSMVIAWSLKSCVKNNLFGAPSCRSIRRPYENPGTNGNPRSCSSYCLTFSTICSTMTNEATYTLRLYKRSHN